MFNGCTLKAHRRGALWVHRCDKSDAARGCDLGGDYSPREIAAKV